MQKNYKKKQKNKKKNQKMKKKKNFFNKIHTKPKKFKTFQKWSKNSKIPKNSKNSYKITLKQKISGKKSYPRSFPILGGHNLNRALQSSQFQISGRVP